MYCSPTLCIICHTLDHMSEDVKVGTYDELMDETEDSSDDVDEDETTDLISSQLSWSRLHAPLSCVSDRALFLH